MNNDTYSAKYKFIHARACGGPWGYVRTGEGPRGREGGGEKDKLHRRRTESRFCVVIF